ncbi:hypothetical protein ASZ78_015340 [Callipepla squamata]|uniref:DNA oxidative demethylase ALKBH2 n=1 Tax=Callipepla squamata TaxID=9009 RepID=A0A226N3T5_CALSU|nr:hypothetical protein ASZ78_015340 [Callipepla squamata]
MDGFVVKRSAEERGGDGKRPRLEEAAGGPPRSSQPRQEIRAQGLSLEYRLLFGRAEADAIFQQLEKDVEYFEGVTFSPKPWIPVLIHIRERLALDTGHTFNFVLINRYKDGEDHIGEHRDDEKELVPRSPIASVSFGACRDFVFRHCDSRGKNATRRIKPVKLQLAHGSLLMMKYPTNVYWYHSLPIRRRVLAPRINLTFRKMMAVDKK